MPSFDIVSRFNFAELDNAINNTNKAIAARFDFRGSPVEISVDKKEKQLKMVADDATKVRGVREMFHTASVKRGLDGRSFDWGEPEETLGARIKCVAKLKDGLDQDTAKSIVKTIKETKLKVQASIQGEEVRVTGKQIDDLQSVMKVLGASGLQVPLQYVNLKS